MTATPEQLDEARRFVDRHVRHGAVLAPVTSPLVRIANELLDAMIAAGTATACEHRGTQADRAAGATIIPIDGARPMELSCVACFDSDPTPTCCQICQRRPSPGLRTIVARNLPDPLVWVARLCRDCRPGRVA